MNNASDAIWLSAITAFSAVAVAVTNMIGSVLILYIRARYGYHEQSNGKVAANDVRDIPIAGGKPTA